MSDLLAGIDVDESGKLGPETTQGKWACSKRDAKLEDAVRDFIRTNGGLWP